LTDEEESLLRKPDQIEGILRPDESGTQNDSIKGLLLQDKSFIAMTGKRLLSITIHFYLQDMNTSPAVLFYICSSQICGISAG